jgi:hypothetical protein
MHCEFTLVDLTPALIFDLLESPEKILETALDHLGISKVQLVEVYTMKDEDSTGKSILHELIFMKRYQTVKRVH